MTQNFATSPKRSETSKNNEKYSLKLNQNSNEDSFGNEQIFEYWYIRFSPTSHSLKQLQLKKIWNYANSDHILRLKAMKLTSSDYPYKSA